MARASLIDHLILAVGCAIMLGPLAMLMSRGLTLALPPNTASMLLTSGAVALGTALVKTAVSLPAAFALTYFRLPVWIMPLLLLPLFFPIEARLLPTILVTDALGLLNTYTGLILPIAATGLGTLVLHLRLKQMPPEILEAARLDGAGPGRAFWDIILPLSLPMLMMLFAFFFVLGWNQYLWPLVASPGVTDRVTLVAGLNYAGPGSPASISLATIAMVPPLVVFALAQRWIVRGLAPIAS